MKQRVSAKSPYCQSDKKLQEMVVVSLVHDRDDGDSEKTAGADGSDTERGIEPNGEGSFAVRVGSFRGFQVAGEAAETGGSDATLALCGGVCELLVEDEGTERLEGGFVNGGHVWWLAVVVVVAVGF